MYTSIYDGGHTNVHVVFVMTEVGGANGDGTKFTTRSGDVHGGELEATTLARVLHSRSSMRGRTSDDL